jgi:hypothetical protein
MIYLCDLLEVYFWSIPCAYSRRRDVLGSLVQIATLPVVILAPLSTVSLLWNVFFCSLHTCFLGMDNYESKETEAGLAIDTSPHSSRRWRRSRRSYRQ